VSPIEDNVINAADIPKKCSYLDSIQSNLFSMRSIYRQQRMNQKILLIVIRKLRRMFAKRLKISRH